MSAMRDVDCVCWMGEDVIPERVFGRGMSGWVRYSNKESPEPCPTSEYTFYVLYLAIVLADIMI